MAPPGASGAPQVRTHLQPRYATLALIDAFARSQDAALRPAIEHALGLIARAQNPYAGWRYFHQPDGDNDSSVTGTLLYVLARARDAGFAVDEGSVTNGRALIDRFTDEETGRTGYQQRGGLPARMMETMERFPAEASESLTAIALSARLATGVPGNTPTVLRGTALLLERLPAGRRRAAASTSTTGSTPRPRSTSSVATRGKSGARRSYASSSPTRSRPATPTAPSPPSTRGAASAAASIPRRSTCWRSRSPCAPTDA
jgi:hypothetical protein